jgi:hypothetical protein
MNMGMSVGRASSTLVGLANEIQGALEELGRQGMKLAEEIRVVDRKHLELDIESMKLKTKDRRSDFFDSARGLMLEKSNEWFAFFHMQS